MFYASILIHVPFGDAINLLLKNNVIIMNQVSSSLLFFNFDVYTEP